jgi:sensor histidine kinase YesM
MKIKNIGTALQRWLKSVLMHRVLLHFAFWTIIFIQGLAYSSDSRGAFSFQSIFTAFLMTGFYALPITIDSCFLIKRYFKQRQYTRYFVFLSLVILTNSFVAVYVLLEVGSLYILFIQHVFNTVGFLIIVSIIRFYKDNMQQQIKFQELQSMQVQSELKVLKSQVHPHFLFNTLNSIYSLALDQSEKTADVVLKLSDLMRYTLHQSQMPYVPLSHEIDYLQNYLWLEQLRLGARADIQLKIDGDTTASIAPMLFLPFVENSFKHGVDQSSGKVFVRIHIQINDKGLCFKIENNKSEKAFQSSLEPESGLGLANVERRLAILYPGKHQLQREEKPDLYRVILNIYW